MSRRSCLVSSALFPLIQFIVNTDFWVCRGRKSSPSPSPTLQSSWFSPSYWLRAAAKLPDTTRVMTLNLCPFQARHKTRTPDAPSAPEHPPTFFLQRTN